MIHTLLQISPEIKDTQCGFKMYKKKVAKNIFSKLQTTKMMFDIEVILRMKKMRYKIASFPVEWKNDEDTKFDPMRGTIENFYDLFLIKMKHHL
jgi:dolichyl-phosphate beta-glucosyltransferase